MWTPGRSTRQAGSPTGLFGDDPLEGLAAGLSAEDSSVLHALMAGPGAARVPRLAPPLLRPASASPTQRPHAHPDATLTFPADRFREPRLAARPAGDRAQAVGDFVTWGTPQRPVAPGGFPLAALLGRPYRAGPAPRRGWTARRRRLVVGAGGSRHPLGPDPVLPGPEGLPRPSGLFVGKPLIVRSPITRLGFVADRLAAGEAVGSNVAVASIGSRPALQAVGASTAKDDVVAGITSHGVISASA